MTRAARPAAMKLENMGSGRTIVDFGDVVQNFPFHVAFARNDLIQLAPPDRPMSVGQYQLFAFRRLSAGSLR